MRSMALATINELETVLACKYAMSNSRHFSLQAPELDPDMILRFPLPS
jgi:hypothetical protein